VPVGGLFGAGPGPRGELPNLAGLLVGGGGVRECGGARRVSVLGPAKGRHDVGNLRAAGPHRVRSGSDVHPGQRVCVRALHTGVQCCRAQRRRIGQREPDGGSAGMPVRRPHTVADPGQVPVESAATRRDAAHRVEDPFLRGRALASKSGRMGLQARDVVTAGKQGLQLAVGGRGDQPGQCRRRVAVRTIEAQHFTGQALFFGGREFGGSAGPPAPLNR